MNAEALTRCIALAIERIEGGAPPPAKLATDVKRLAKEAGVDVQDAAQSLVATALRSPVVGKAPQAFWNGFRAPIVAWARQSREARDALFALTPDIPTARWLPLLEATGVADEMRSGERGVLESIGAKTWASPVQPRRSFRWGQSVGMSRKLDFNPHRVFSYRRFSFSWFVFIKPVLSISE